MEIVHPRVAGIDVHKKIIWVAVRMPGEAPGQRVVTVRSACPGADQPALPVFTGGEAAARAETEATFGVSVGLTCVTWRVRL